MHPATTFFVSQVKQNLSKTTTAKLYPVKKWATRINNNALSDVSDYIYSIATLQCKVCLMSIKTGHFIKLYKIK